MENTGVIPVLLVDDESDFRHIITKRLSKRGIQTIEASSGEDCLKYLTKMPMDVVVLDIKMPGMNGIETLDKIHAKYPKTEVILLTGHSSVSDGVEGIKAGAYDYLTKPVETEQLAKKIRQAYEKVIRTEEKEAEEKYRKDCEAKFIATERLVSLGTLAAGVAHEINNPLAIISESLGWLQRVIEKNEMLNETFRNECERPINKIEKSLCRIKKITHQLLGIVRKNDVTITEININSFLMDTVDLVKHEAQNKDVTIVFDESAPTFSIWSDPFQLRQVMINLLNNAIYASNKGKTVTIALRQTKNGTEIAVQDQGAGIPEDHLSKIFEPFFSTKDPGEGTGLGLYVARNIIEKLDGIINVKSSLGKGTTFIIFLPKYIKEL